MKQTRDQEFRGMKLGLLVGKLCWGDRDLKKFWTKESRTNWIRLSRYWVSRGAVTFSSLLKCAEEYTKASPPSDTWNWEEDVERRKNFSKWVTEFVKERRKRLGRDDPQRVFERKMKSRDKDWKKRALAREMICRERCPLCGNSLGLPARPGPADGEFHLPDCCGYGGVWVTYTDVTDGKIRFKKIREVAKTSG